MATSMVLAEPLVALACDPEMTTGCTSSVITVARSILVFFAINIVGHAVTMTKRPGQRLVWTILSACGMVLCPIVARVAYSTSMMNIIFVLRLRWRQHSAHRWNKRLMIALFGENMGACDMQSAIDCGAVAVEIPKDRAQELGWTDELDLSECDALFFDGTPVNDKTMNRTRFEYLFVPIGTKSHSDKQVVSTDSLMQTFITIGQLVYGAIELYSSWSTSVRQDGLSSPFIVIVPYIIGSFTNMIINVFVYTYPYVVVLPYLEDVKSHRRSVHACSHPLSENTILSSEKPAADTAVKHTHAEKEEKRSSTHNGTSPESSWVALGHGSSQSREALDALPSQGPTSDAQNAGYSKELKDWAQDMYELEPEVVAAIKQHHLVILLATLVTLAIILSLTHARIGDRVTAASFLGWIFGGWWYIACSVAFRTRLQELGRRHRQVSRDAWSVTQLWGLSIVSVVPSVMLSVWGMVTAIRVLIPYYSNCENVQ